MHLYELRKDQMGALLDAAPVVIRLNDLSRLLGERGSEAYARALKRTVAGALAWVEQLETFGSQLTELPDLRKETEFQMAFGDLLAFGSWPGSLADPELLLQNAWQSSPAFNAEVIAVICDKKTSRAAALSMLRAMAPRYASGSEQWVSVLASDDEVLARQSASLAWPPMREKAAFSARAALIARRGGPHIANGGAACISCCCKVPACEAATARQRERLEGFAMGTARSLALTERIERATNARHIGA